MAVRTREELLTRVSEYIGEDTSDAAIELLEDVTATYDDIPGGEDWRARYDELDTEWRRRYRERFEAGSDVLPTGEKAGEGTHEEVKEEPVVEVENEPIDLFIDELEKPE